MEDYIKREEHNEFAKRIDAENARQNRRLEILDKSQEQMMALVSSVEKLALSMENMMKEQEKQGQRLEDLESRDGEMWRKITGYILTTVAGIIVGYIFKQIGF